MSRDWQKDMEMCSQLDEWYEHPWEAGVEEGSNVIRIYEIIPEEPCVFVAECENDLTTDFIIDAREALPYWLQQYAQLQSDFNYITTVKDSYKKRLEEWGNRALESEAREQKLREAMEEVLRDAYKWENPYEGYGDLQRVLDSLYPEEGESK